MPPKFTVIPNTPAPDTPAQRVRERIKAIPKPADLGQCHRCGGREFIETKTGMLFKDGRLQGGVKNHLCLNCLVRGERVVV